MTANPTPADVREASLRRSLLAAADALTCIATDDDDHVVIADLREVAALPSLGFVQAPAGWRDIASAPKDGTEMLGWVVHEGDAFNPDPFQRPSLIAWDEGHDVEPFTRKPGWQAKWVGTVTHWQPLPTPPEQEADNGR